jgi:hypothetical protein
MSRIPITKESKSPTRRGAMREKNGERSGEKSEKRTGDKGGY